MRKLTLPLPGKITQKSRLRVKPRQALSQWGAGRACPVCCTSRGTVATLNLPYPNLGLGGPNNCVGVPGKYHTSGLSSQGLPTPSCFWLSAAYSYHVAI